MTQYRPWNQRNTSISSSSTFPLLLIDKMVTTTLRKGHFVLKVMWCAAVVCGGNVNIYRLLLAIKAVTSSETICDLYLLDGGLFVAIKTWLHDSLHWISGSLLCLLLVMISHSRFSLKRSQTTTPSTHFMPSSPSIHDSFNPVVQNSVFLYFLMFKKANSSFIRNSLKSQVFLLRCIPNCCRTD